MEFETKPNYTKSLKGAFSVVWISAASPSKALIAAINKLGKSRYLIKDIRFGPKLVEQNNYLDNRAYGERYKQALRFGVSCFHHLY
jgi:hypothetical protein